METEMKPTGKLSKIEMKNDRFTYTYKMDASTNSFNLDTKEV